MRRGAFSLVELMMVVVIIGILSIVIVPRFSKMSDSAKISDELSTAYSIQTVIETANGEWLVNESSFKWGVNRPSSELNINGFPNTLGDGTGVEYIIKDADRFSRVKIEGNSNLCFKGVASSEVTLQISGKPDTGDYWEYNTTTGTFRLIENE